MLYPKSNKLNTRYWHVYAKTSAKTRSLPYLKKKKTTRDDLSFYFWTYIA